MSRELRLDCEKPAKVFHHPRPDDDNERLFAGHRTRVTSSGDRWRAVYVDFDERALDPRNRRADTISASNPPCRLYILPSSFLSLFVHRAVSPSNAGWTSSVRACVQFSRFVSRSFGADGKLAALIRVPACMYFRRRTDRSQTVPLPRPCVSRCVVQSRSSPM